MRWLSLTLLLTICNAFKIGASNENATKIARELRHERQKSLLDSICARSLLTESAKKVCAKHRLEQQRNTGSSNVVFMTAATSTTTTTPSSPPRATETKSPLRPNTAKGFFRRLFMKPPSNDVPATEEASVNPEVKDGEAPAGRVPALCTNSSDDGMLKQICQELQSDMSLRPQVTAQQRTRNPEVVLQQDAVPLQQRQRGRNALGSINDEPILTRLNLGTFLQADETQDSTRILVNTGRFMDSENWEALRKQWIEPFIRNFAHK